MKEQPTEWAKTFASCTFEKINTENTHTQKSNKKSNTPINK